MSRPANANAEATRARIVASSSELLAEHGLTGTSMAMIAKASGVSSATIVYYFGTKEGLHKACVEAMDRELSELGPALMATATQADSADDIVASVVRAGWRFVRSHRVAHLLLLRAALDGGMARDRWETVHGPFLDGTTALLAPMTGLSPLHVRMSAQTFIHLLVRYAVQTDAELRQLTQVETTAEAERLVGDHLVAVARSLFLRKND